MTTTTSAATRDSKPAAPPRATHPRRFGRIHRVFSAWLDRPLASFHLIISVFGLMLGYGLLMVLSSSAATAFRRSDSAFSVFTNQASFAVLGLVAFFFVVRMPLHLIRSLSTAAVLVALALLVAVLIPGVGSNWNGARSWITIGHSFQFQPSEVAKLALLLWSAHVLAMVRSPYRRLKDLLVPAAPVFALMVGLVMLQPDLGTTVTLAIVFFAVLFFAGAQWWIFGGIAGLGVAVMIYLATSAGYRMDRVAAWLHPDKVDPKFTYQSFQGLYAMGSGGLFGVGIGESKMKWGRLPMADSDFIFAIIGEELGLIGALVVVLLFGVLAYTGLRIARRNTDPFIKIVAAAGTIWLVGQATINIGYVVGLLPVTGIPLPMFSAGGTSLVITMVVFGLLANFARREPQAQAALYGPGRRGIVAFFGIGTSGRGGRKARQPSKRVQRLRAERAARRDSDGDRPRASVERPRASVDRPRIHGDRPRAASRQRTLPAPSARRAPARTRARSPRRAPKYVIRRAFGFPPPARGSRASKRRRVPERAGRTLR